MANACDIACSVTLSHLTLCNPMDCTHQDPSVHGIILARILEWLPFPLPGDVPDPGIKPVTPAAPALAGSFFITWKACL